MKFKFRFALASALVLFGMSAVIFVWRQAKPAEAAVAGVTSASPCVGAPAPTAWKHVVVVMMENQTHPNVIGNANAPYLSDLAKKCGTAYSGTTGAAPKNNWHDANYKVDGTSDGSYNSKPSYATLTSGVSPSVHGLIDDTYTKTTNVDNIYNQLKIAGKNARNYYSGPVSTTPCASSNFTGAYHDTLRYYTNLGGQSSDPTTYCNTHDKALPQFMTDVNSGALPAFSMVFPTNCENMHSCSSVTNVVQNGDNWVKGFLTPFLDSAQYKSGDTAVFVVWDEDTAIPNVLLAPSVVPGSKVPAPTGNPISHFAALRTWEEMLGLPLIGDTSKAPSMLSFMNGGGAGAPAPDTTLPNVAFSTPAAGTSVTAGSKVPVTLTATDNIAISKIVLSVDNQTSPLATLATSPYSFTWDTTGLAPGAHTLTAVATDTSGNPATATRTVTIISAATCPAVSTNLGTATMSVNVSSAGTYKVWSLMAAPDATNNSFLLQVDNECPVVVGDAGMTAGAWKWVNYRDGNAASTYSVTMAAGAHNLTLIGREAGVDVDRILLLTDACTPTGAGDNCTAVADTTPPKASLSAPAPDAKLAGNTVVSATAVDDAGGTGVTKVEFYLNGDTLIGTALTAPYQVQWNTQAVIDGTYTLSAKAYDAAGNMGPTQVINVTVSNTDATAPSAPTSFETTNVSANSVTLGWGAASDNPGGTGIGGYNLYRDNLLIHTAAPAETSFTDATATPNTTYSYSLEAFDRASPANLSPQLHATAVTPGDSDTQAPSTPTGLTVTNTSTAGVTLSWGAATDNVGVTRYVINRFGGNGSVTLLAGKATTYVDTTVSPGTSYTYNVVAADAAGNASAPSNEVAASVPPVAPQADTQSPTSPQAVTATAPSPSQVDIGWEPASDNVRVAGYEVFRGNASLGKTISLSFGDGTVTSGSTYTYTVVAFDAAGNRSAKSTPASVTVPGVESATAERIKLKPTDDAFISGFYPTRNYGSSDHLTANKYHDYEFLTKFKVTGVNGRRIVKARLRLYVTNGSKTGGQFFQANSNNWSEDSVTWKNAPKSTASIVQKLGSVSVGKYVYVDVSSVIKGDGTYSFRTKTDTSDRAEYSSSEGAATPKLIIDVQ